MSPQIKPDDSKRKIPLYFLLSFKIMLGLFIYFVTYIFKFSCSNRCHVSSKPAVTSTINFLVIITCRIKAHSLSFIKSCLLSLNFSNLCFNIYNKINKIFLISFSKEHSTQCIFLLSIIKNSSKHRNFKIIIP